MLTLQLKYNLNKTEIISHLENHLENNGTSIKLSLSSWFLIMTFNLCFYNQLWVEWVCVHIGKSFGNIGRTHLLFPKCLWLFDTEKNVH